MSGGLKQVVTALLPIAILIAGCQPIHPESAPAKQMVDPTPAITKASAEEQIANAMTAAPPVVATEATIIGYPADEGGEMVVLRTGTNSWTCYTDSPATPDNDPVCYDAVFATWNEAFAAGTEPQITKPGIAYMLAGGSDPSNTDPMATAPAAGEQWITTPPRIMVVVPTAFDASDFTSDYRSGEPYIMWKGTPYVHLVIPVVAAEVTSAEPLTITASADEQIHNISEAASAVIVANATLMGYPSQEGGDMVLLQEGTNGWVCYPDRLVSPGNDPSCNDATVEKGFSTGTTRVVPHPGISYMLAGGSDESNSDPMATGPMPGDDWVTTPSHVMLMVSGGFDVANFTNDHMSGYPYIMYDDTDYEHLMIPVADLPKGQ